MYGSKKARRHGGAGGSELEISLDEGEYVTGVKIRIGMHHFHKLICMTTKIENLLNLAGWILYK